MKELNEENLSTAIIIGSAVCRTLSICCAQRAHIIFKIYETLEGLKEDSLDTTEVRNITEGQIGQVMGGVNDSSVK
jgi:hypothetical protein